MDRVIIKQDKKKVIKLFILGLIISFVSICELIVGLIELKPIYLIIGLIATIFFCSCLMFIIKSMLGSRPVLIIDKDGITDESTAASIGFVAWKEIKSIEAEKHFGQKYIGIKIYDLNEVMKRISLPKRINMKICLMLKYSPVSINLDTAERDFQEVLGLLQRRLEEYRNNSIQEK